MKIAIMQPYFMPYIGYFQLINAVDTFVIYDDIKYTKKGWINRNRILVNGKDNYISLPLKKDSDYANIYQRELSDSWKLEKIKLLNKIKSAYIKAPYYETIFPIIEDCLENNDTNLFNFILNSIKIICKELNINTNLVVSSSLKIDQELKSKDKVITICKKMHAKYYINPIGGMELYVKNDFIEEGIHLNFLKTDDIQYTQFKNKFVPFLSIIDVLMFNNNDAISLMLKSFTLK